MSEKAYIFKNIKLYGLKSLSTLIAHDGAVSDTFADNWSMPPLKEAVIIMDITVNVTKIGICFLEGYNFLAKMTINIPETRNR